MYCRRPSLVLTRRPAYWRRDGGRIIVGVPRGGIGPVTRNGCRTPTRRADVVDEYCSGDCGGTVFCGDRACIMYLFNRGYSKGECTDLSAACSCTCGDVTLVGGGCRCTVAVVVCTCTVALVDGCVIEEAEEPIVFEAHVISSYQSLVRLVVAALQLSDVQRMAMALVLVPAPHVIASCRALLVDAARQAVNERKIV